MIFEPALAQAAGGGAAGGLGLFMPLILMIPIFYFLIIRPQQKKMKAHQQMLDAIKRGDVVVTSGGLVGKVTKVNDGELDVEIAKDVKVKVVHSMVSSVRSKTEPQAADSKS